jgi:hypothetical protein
MQRSYPVDTTASCWALDKEPTEEHDYVYLGMANTSLDLVGISVKNEAQRSGSGDWFSYQNITAGPFTLALHRCVRCGIGMWGERRMPESRPPTDAERLRLEAVETARIIHP